MFTCGLCDFSDDMISPCKKRATQHAINPLFFSFSPWLLPISRNQQLHDRDVRLRSQHTHKNANAVGPVYITQATKCTVQMKIKVCWTWRTKIFFLKSHFLLCIKCNVCFHFHLERLVTFPKLLSPEDIRLPQTAIYWTGQPHLFHSSPSWEAVILSQYPWHDLPPSLFPTKKRAKATCIQNSWLKHPAA